MGDVDLVMRKWDGRPHRRVTTRLLGADEFAANKLAYGYPAVVAHAWAAAEELRVALTSAAEPFGRHWRTWMELL